MKYAFFNGNLTPVEDLNVHVSDLSIHRAYGVFDFFKLRNGQNPWIDWYLTRFFQSMSLTLLEIEWSKEELLQMIQAMILKNDSPDSCVKLICTGGLSADGFTPQGKANFFMLNYPIKAPAPEAYDEGVKLISRQYRRTLPRVKSIDYFYSVTLLPHLRKAGAIDVLYHLDDMISETSRSNIYMVKEGEVITPGDHILEGITRKRLLQSDQPVNIREGAFSLQSLYSADEVFITSTTKAVLPVVRIDDRTIGSGKPGKITQLLKNRVASF